MNQYADASYYIEYGGTMTDVASINKFLKKASRIIDSLTYRRIAKLGFDNLSTFQQELVQDCCCDIADYLNDNGDALSSPFSSYSLNGASISLGSNNVNMVKVNGIYISESIYSTLMQSGLCDRRC